MAKTCIVCSKRAYSDYCVSHKPRKAIAVNKPLPKATKPIKQRGKVTSKWFKTRKAWFEENESQYYKCYLCTKLIPKEETTLDHVIPRSARPDLRYVFSNLKPACYPCNNLKGSKH